MKVRNRGLLSFFLFIGDLLIIPFSFLSGHYLRYGDFLELNIKVPFFPLLGMTLAYIMVFYFFDLYDLKNKYLSFHSLANLFIVLVIAAVCASFSNYALFLQPVGRGIFLLANITLFCLIFLWRILFHQFFFLVFNPPRLIIIGAGEAGKKISLLLEDMKESFEFIGFLADQKEWEQKDLSEGRQSIIGLPEQVMELCSIHKINQVVITQPVEKNSRLGKLLIKLRLDGVKVHDMVTFYLIHKERIPIDHVSETWILNAKVFDGSEKSMSSRIKRLMDIFFSLFFLILTSPLFLAIAVLVKLSSEGPIFYTQKRVGQNENVFSLIKFRSMIQKAETHRAVWAREHDARITSVGKFLRKSHLDELPQLINILKGNMSMVGPRPERPDYEKDLRKKIPFYSLRHFLKPGLTGWAQVNYPYAASVEASKDKLEYDLYYVYHKTLLFDLRIILKTFKNFFLRKQQGI